MVRKAVIGLVLGALFVTGSKAEIYQSVDKFSGVTTFTTKTRVAHTEGGVLSGLNLVSFSLITSTAFTTKPAPLCIAAETFTQSWVFISSGNSLLLKLDDGSIVSLSGDGSANYRKIVSYDSVTEDALWCITVEQMRLIANSKQIEFRILGDSKNLTGRLDKNTVADIVEFSLRAPDLIGYNMNH